MSHSGGFLVTDVFIEEFFWQFFLLLSFFFRASFLLHRDCNIVMLHVAVAVVDRTE